MLSLVFLCLYMAVGGAPFGGRLYTTLHMKQVFKSFKRTFTILFGAGTAAPVTISNYYEFGVIKIFTNIVWTLTKKYYVCQMETDKSQLPPLKVDRTKLITQAEYGRRNNLIRQRVNDLVKAKKVNTVEIIGGTLILLD